MSIKDSVDNGELAVLVGLELLLMFFAIVIAATVGPLAYCIFETIMWSPVIVIVFAKLFGPFGVVDRANAAKLRDSQNQRARQQEAEAEAQRQRARLEREKEKREAREYLEKRKRGEL